MSNCCVVTHKHRKSSFSFWRWGYFTDFL